jgi:hypothetical protein
MTKKCTPKKPKIVWVGSPPITPITGQQSRELDRRIQKRKERLRKRIDPCRMQELEWQVRQERIRRLPCQTGKPEPEMHSGLPNLLEWLQRHCYQGKCCAVARSRFSWRRAQSLNGVGDGLLEITQIAFLVDRCVKSGRSKSTSSSFSGCVDSASFLRSSGASGNGSPSTNRFSRDSHPCEETLQIPGQTKCHTPARREI